MKKEANISRKGQFLWMDSAAREKHINSIKQKIENKYYFSDLIITRIVDEIAPVMADTLAKE